MNVSIFESVIRTVGGLLSGYHFTKDKRLLEKVKELADILILPMEEDPNGIFSFVNLKTKKKLDFNQAVLSEIGSIQLEFFYLSYLLNDP